MEDDFKIVIEGKQWKVRALSDRAVEMAENDPRFRDAEAAIDDRAVNALYGELTQRGFFVGTPNGLAPQGPMLLMIFLVLFALVLLIPLLLAGLL